MANEVRVQQARNFGRSRKGSGIPDLQGLRQQLEDLARTRSAAVAQHMANRVAPLLRPAWQIVVPDEAALQAFGFLRQIESKSNSLPSFWQNVAVLRSAASDSPDLRLEIPSPAEVFDLLDDPRRALINSVGGVTPNRMRRDTSGSHATGVLEPASRPVLRGLGDVSLNDDEIADQLRALLRQWFDLAKVATSDKREIAHLLLAAALLARQAAIHGDRATVEWFVHRWLGYCLTDARIDGASAALLENSWFPRSPDRELSSARDEVTQLRTDVLYQHRLHRPVWETQVRGQQVDSLSEDQATRHPTDLADEVGSRAFLAAVRLRAGEFRSIEWKVVNGLVDGISKAELRRELGVSRHRFEKATARIEWALRVTEGWPLSRK